MIHERDRQSTDSKTPHDGIGRAYAYMHRAPKNELYEVGGKRFDGTTYSSEQACRGQPYYQF